MFKILNAAERESICYVYFHKHGIKSRKVLRDVIKQHGLTQGVMINFIVDVLSDYLLKKREDKKEEMK